MSHTSDLAVVVLGGAVDVELLDRDFSRARRRFISPKEEQLPQSEHFAVAVWCAKETLYKLSGRRELDILRDIAITSLDLAAGLVEGLVCGTPHLLHTRIVAGRWLVVFFDYSSLPRF